MVYASAFIIAPVIVIEESHADPSEIGIPAEGYGIGVNNSNPVAPALTRIDFKAFPVHPKEVPQAEPVLIGIPAGGTDSVELKTPSPSIESPAPIFMTPRTDADATGGALNVFVRNPDPSTDNPDPAATLTPPNVVDVAGIRV